MFKYRYRVIEGRGGKSNRWYVWDLVEQRVHKGQLQKQDAIDLEHDLNGKKALHKKAKPHKRGA